MGQKINPIGLRLGINRTWDSRWYANTGEYGRLLHEDLKIREYLEKELKQAAVSKIVIERPHKKCRVTIHAARPGLIIGKKGADIEKLRKKLTEMTKSETHLNIVEVRKPETDAKLIAQSIAQQLERRVAFRRAMKRAVQSAMRLGAEGIRINCAGRLGAWNGIARAGCRCTRCAPTSTTALPRRRPPMASAASRCGCSRARSLSTTRWRPNAARLRARARVVRVVATASTPETHRNFGETRCCSQSAQSSASSSRAAFMAQPRVARI
jgi:ribosomal protein S3